MDTVPDKTPDPPEAPKANPPRRWKRAATVAIGGAALLVTAVFFAHRPLAAWWIRKEARARGVELDFDDFSLARDLVVLRGARATLAGLGFVHIEARALEISVDGLEPTRLDASGVVVSMDGPASDALVALSTWADAHAEVVRLPVGMDGSLRWGSNESPWLTLAGRATSRAEGKTFDGSMGFEGTNLGVMVARADPKGMVALGFGAKALEEAKLRATIDTVARPMKLVATLPSVAVADVFRARSLAAPKAFADVRVEGTTTILLGATDPAVGFSGSASFVLAGFVPPHPRELDGIVFGKKTRLEAAFEITPDLGELRVSKATMKAGAFELAGPGSVTREGKEARISFDLKGSVPCTELGASAVGAHVRGLVGDILKGVARFGLGGAVGVRVVVNADTRALEQAKVEQTATVGCRLR